MIYNQSRSLIIRARSIDRHRNKQLMKLREQFLTKVLTKNNFAKTRVFNFFPVGIRSLEVNIRPWVRFQKISTGWPEAPDRPHPIISTNLQILPQREPLLSPIIMATWSDLLRIL